MARLNIIETRLDAASKPVGCIEDVFGTGTSFNVYRRYNGSQQSFKKSGEIINRLWEFHKSAYKLATARKFLEAL